MTSESKLEANRRNAQKSTGPKTEAGKLRSSQNALKHGLTAEHVILENEDAEAYNELLGDWLDDCVGGGSIERGLVERAVRNLWKLRRVGQHEHAVLSERVRHATDHFDLEKNLRAEELGLRLVSDPICRYGVSPIDPRSLATFDAWFRDDDPPKLVLQLQSTLQGVDWMLNQWHELDGLLEREGYWHYNDKFRAIRLMGRRPQDVLDEFAIAMIFVQCRAAHPDPSDLGEDIDQAMLGLPGKPSYDRRVKWLKCFRYTEPGDALAELRKLVKQRMEFLVALREQYLAPIAARDRAEAVDRAMFDDSAKGTLARRYETACERDFHRSVAGLMKLRKESDKEPRDPRPELECEELTTCTEPETPVEPSEIDPARHRRRPFRNEPTPEPRSNPSNPQTQPFSTPASPPNDAG
jgi:hypothetical protein